MTAAINIVLTMPDPDYNFTKSQNDLTKNRESIGRGAGRNTEDRVWLEQSQTSGLARGGQAGSMRANFEARQFGGPRSPYFCPVFKTVDIEIYYGTVIFIASDLKPETCPYRVTMDHELTHHTINQNIVKKYTDRLRADLPRMMQEIEGLGYVHQDKLPQRFKLMESSLNDAIQIYMESMMTEMATENAKIDTVENYQHEAALCTPARKR